MAEKKDSLFREKSLESVNSPESLNSSLKVTTPGVWILLAGIIVILVGIIAWGILGRIEATSKVAVCAESSRVYCLIPRDDLDSVMQYKKITLNGEEYSLLPNVSHPVSISEEELSVYVLIAGELEEGEIVYPVDVDTILPEGVYTGYIVTESIAPASFLFN